MRYHLRMPFDPEAFTVEARRNWDLVAPRYAELSAARFARIADSFVAFCGLSRGQSVLDVACGPGTASFAAAKAVGKEGRVTGLDLSAGMLEQARARARQEGFEISLSEGNVESMPFPEASFDAVISQLGLMLFPRPDAALAEMARVAKTGGTVACLVQGRREKMLSTSLLMGALVKYAPRIKEEGGPNIYGFAPDGVLQGAFLRAGLRPEAWQALEGTLAFDSAEDYWRTMTEASGRTGSVLRSLPQEDQEAVRLEVIERARSFAGPKGVAIPYEMVIARARKT